MDDERLYAWGNPWFRWSVVSLVVLTVLSFLVGFVVLPSVQRDYTAGGFWASICRAAGLPANWGVGTATDEGSAYGAALLGGVAAGVFRDVHEAVATCVRLLDPVEPDPQWSAAYERGYRRFRLLYPALRPLEDV